MTANLQKSLRQFCLWAGWCAPRATDIPDNVRIPPMRSWRLEWNSLSASLINAGLVPENCDFESVKWYIAPAIPTSLMNIARPLNGAKYSPDTVFAGVWLRADNSITLTPASAADHLIVRHEMTHAQRGTGGHDDTWFRPEFQNFTGLQPEQLLK